MFSTTTPTTPANAGLKPIAAFRIALTALLLVGWTLTVGSPTRAQAQVNDIFHITSGTFTNHVEYHRIDLPPGKDVVLADLAGPGKITYFYITDDSTGHATDGSGALYAGLVLKVYWDEAAEPSIQVPL
jgi:hypothetical protein